MHVTYRNVNEAFRGLVELMNQYHPALQSFDSRNGKIIRFTEPVMVTYLCPRERVLFNSVRDANPFFHVYESLWMLAGRRDLEPVQWYCSKMKQFSDNGSWLNGAYGYRWRRSMLATNGRNSLSLHLVDQLQVLIEHLRNTPNSRRAVLQMWQVDCDLENVDRSKDTCCNLSAVFQPRDGRLDMTVFNRSNDLVLGMLGANVVHFSFLQEYMAKAVGLEVGIYHQVTCDLHIYEWNWKPAEWLAAEPRGVQKGTYGYSCPASGYKTVPLVQDPATFEQQLPEAAEYLWGPAERIEEAGVAEGWTEPFLAEVALPMYLAYAAHKAGDTRGALSHCEAIAADDWRVASTAWLQRRLDRKQRAPGQWDNPDTVPADRSGS